MGRSERYLPIAMRHVSAHSRGSYHSRSRSARTRYCVHDVTSCTQYQNSIHLYKLLFSGLLTYFSSGFKFKEIQLAVFAGVDGVGIGGAQVLRFMDHKSGMHGPYMEENLSRILAARDEAAASVRGRGVHVLARLDTMFFEGSITREENIRRLQLFDALKVKDEDDIRTLLMSLDYVASLPDDGETPLLGTAGRLLLPKRRCHTV